MHLMDEVSAATQLINSVENLAYVFGSRKSLALKLKTRVVPSVFLESLSLTVRSIKGTPNRNKKNHKNAVSRF